jgi:hypothetical protein
MPTLFWYSLLGRVETKMKIAKQLSVLELFAEKGDVFLIDSVAPVALKFRGRNTNKRFAIMMLDVDGTWMYATPSPPRGWPVFTIIKGTFEQVISILSGQSFNCVELRVLKKCLQYYDHERNPVPDTICLPLCMCKYFVPVLESEFLEKCILREITGKL